MSSVQTKTLSFIMLLFVAAAVWAEDQGEATAEDMELTRVKIGAFSPEESDISLLDSYLEQIDRAVHAAAYDREAQLIAYELQREILHKSRLSQALQLERELKVFRRNRLLYRVGGGLLLAAGGGGAYLSLRQSLDARNQLSTAATSAEYSDLQGKMLNFLGLAFSSGAVGIASAVTVGLIIPPRLYPKRYDDGYEQTIERLRR